MFTRLKIDHPVKRSLDSWRVKDDLMAMKNGIQQETMVSCLFKFTRFLLLWHLNRKFAHHILAAEEQSGAKSGKALDADLKVH